MGVKRAHMVSRSYLRGWADGDDCVRVLDLDRGRSLTQKTNQATVVSYAYNTKHTIVDLEAEFGRIESDGVPAMRSLAEGTPINLRGQEAVVAFLDMHLERGRFADQTKHVARAVAGGLKIEPQLVEMGLGDRLALSRVVDAQAVRLLPLGITNWRWRVESIEQGLATGDGAVLLWTDPSDGALETVTFPLTSTELLVVGADLQAPRARLNFAIGLNCRRWIVDRVDGQLARIFPR